MYKPKRLVIALAGAAALVGALVSVSSAVAAPSGYFDHTHSYGPEDTGIACGSGANSFDVYDSATVHKYGPLFYDKNGNFVFDILYSDTTGAFSNPLTGASLPYTSRSIERDVLAVPGDFSSTFTATTTGVMNITVPGKGVVWQGTGRVVDTFHTDGSETLGWSGPHDDLVYGFLGDTSVAQRLCAALGAT